MFNRIVLILLTLLVSVPGTSAVEMDDWDAYVAFQKDADIIRLKHLKYYGELIEAYKLKVGNYPFMNEANIPLYVHVASPPQEKYTQMKPPYEHKTKSFTEFIQLIEKGLDRTVDEYYDPQYAPDYKPNFYIYMANQGTYYFAIHQHQEYSFSNHVAEHYNKIEISNNANSMNKANSPEKLFASKEFNEKLDGTISKPGFFEAREKKFIHASKQKELKDKSKPK